MGSLEKIAEQYNLCLTAHRVSKVASYNLKLANDIQAQYGILTRIEILWFHIYMTITDDYCLTGHLFYRL